MKRVSGYAKFLRSKKLHYTFISGVICLMAVVLLMMSEPPMIKRLDRIIYDTYLKELPGG